MEGPENVLESAPDTELDNAPAIETEAEEPVDLEALSDQSEESDDKAAEAEDDDSEEIEYDGRKFKAPKGVKDSLLRQADYTRKTQETAEYRRALEAEKQHVARQAAISQEELKTRAKLMNAEEELSRYSQVNWDAWEMESPLDAQAGYRRYTQLKEEAGLARQALDYYSNTRSQMMQQETAKRLEETRRFAESKLPGWTPEVDAKVTKFLMDVGGWDVETLKESFNPQTYNLAYLAWIGHQTLQKPASKPKSTAPTPLRTVASKSSPPARKDLASMSMDEYVAYRRMESER